MFIIIFINNIISVSYIVNKLHHFLNINVFELQRTIFIQIKQILVQCADS